MLIIVVVFATWFTICMNCFRELALFELTWAMDVSQHLRIELALVLNIKLGGYKSLVKLPLYVIEPLLKLIRLVSWRPREKMRLKMYPLCAARDFLPTGCKHFRCLAYKIKLNGFCAPSMYDFTSQLSLEVGIDNRNVFSVHFYNSSSLNNVKL